MTEWIKPCADAACIKVEIIDDLVLIGTTNNVTQIKVTVHEWEAFVTRIQAAALNWAADDINEAATIMSPGAAKIYRQLALTLRGWARRELKS